MRGRLVHVLAVALLALVVSPPASVLSSGVLVAPQSIAAGTFHTLLVKADGSLWAWGFNGFGQLGTGNTTSHTAPTRIGLGTDWQSVSATGNHTLAIKTDGSLWAWGWNNAGQLGTGNTTDLKSPTRIGLGTDWQSVSTGPFHTMAIKTDGSLWAWGSNGLGQLGTGDTISRSAPTRVGTAKVWQSVVAGSNHTVAVKTDGSLWAWGYNGYGQLGTGGVTNRSAPTRVGTAKVWQSLAAGLNHTLALRTDGSLWAWGDNGDGQLGTGDSVDHMSPTRVGTAKGWQSIVAASNHTLAVKTDGSLWAWGNNYYGQLGTGDTDDRIAPTRVGTAKVWSGIAAGVYHNLALKTDGSLYAWGRNSYGELGIGNKQSRVVPTFVLQGAGVPPTYQTFTGSDRYETSILISKKAYPTTAPVVFLVKGDNFPDALAAAPLARAYGGPVVITPSDGLTPAVATELKRLKPAKVFFIGLPAPVRPQVQAALPGVQIVDIVGTDRYHTAVLLAEELRKKIGTITKIVLAPGDKFPDALSVAPLAAKKGWAILLTPQAGPLPTVTADEIGVLGATQAVVVGTWVQPPASVTNVVFKVGTDRYDTSARIAAYAKTMGLTFTHVALATGENYPDALVVAPYLVADGGILLLTQPTAVPAPIRDVLAANAAEVRTLDFVGLPAAIQPVVKGIVE